VLFTADAGAIEPYERRAAASAALGEGPARVTEAGGGGVIFREVVERFRLQPQSQVRIEQHMTIRIAPQSRPVTLPPRFMLDMQQREAPPRFVERNIGRCVSVANISGVQPDEGSRLILFLRDRRMISAMLDRACRARDFYSGFYVERASDGRICVDRDTLLSRSGANCKLTRIRQLVDADE
jgi:hypothetical protein